MPSSEPLRDSLRRSGSPALTRMSSSPRRNICCKIWIPMCGMVRHGAPSRIVVPSKVWGSEVRFFGDSVAPPDQLSGERGVLDRKIDSPRASPAAFWVLHGDSLRMSALTSIVCGDNQESASAMGRRLGASAVNSRDAPMAMDHLGSGEVNISAAIPAFCGRQAFSGLPCRQGQLHSHFVGQAVDG
jgi:hypothetical protein